MGRPEIIELIFALIDSSGRSGDDPLNGNHIYSVKAPDLGRYRVAPEEPVMKGPNTLGQIFHMDLYSTDADTLRSAIDQLIRRSGAVTVELCYPGVAQMTGLILRDSEPYYPNL